MGPGAKVPAWSPGAPGIAGRFLPLHEYVCFPGEKVHNLCQIFKGLHSPKSGKNHRSERQMRPASMVHTRGKAVPLEPGLLPTCCVFLGQSLPVSCGPGRCGEAGSTQVWSLLPHESGGPWPGSQDKLFPSHDSQQVWGVFHQDTAPASNSRLHRSPLPSPLRSPLRSLQGTSRGRSS